MIEENGLSRNIQFIIEDLVMKRIRAKYLTFPSEDLNPRFWTKNVNNIYHLGEFHKNLSYSGLIDRKMRAFHTN